MEELINFIESEEFMILSDEEKIEYISEFIINNNIEAFKELSK